MSDSFRPAADSTVTCPECAHSFAPESGREGTPQTEALALLRCPTCGFLFSLSEGEGPALERTAESGQESDSAPAIASARADQPPPWPTHIDRFEIRGELGVGGFGRVYDAFDPTLK